MLNIVLNVVFAVTGLCVLVGWIRYRNRDNYRDIRPAEISEDFAAAEELLEDALSEQSRLDSGQRS